MAGTTVRISFQNGQLGASAGCNAMGGPYRIEGSRLISGQLAMTEMACEPPLMEQDRWVAELLGGATVALDRDTLTLTGSTVRVTLLDREVAVTAVVAGTARYTIEADALTIDAGGIGLMLRAAP